MTSLHCFQILELTLLIADYMNALGCVLPNTPNATLTRLDSRRSGRSKTKERDSDRSGGSMGHRIQASAEPDILRATPEMESKMQHHHHQQQHHHHPYQEDVGSKRRITADS